MQAQLTVAQLVEEGVTPIISLSSPAFSSSFPHEGTLTTAESVLSVCGNGTTSLGMAYVSSTNGWIDCFRSLCLAIVFVRSSGQRFLITN